ncbi:MAG TPA: hypothetical protein PK511_12685, partial [Chitinophagales bacterium]|nr:hypothetical protein [Chitinophagales bacterium]
SSTHTNRVAFFLRREIFLHVRFFSAAEFHSGAPPQKLQGSPATKDFHLIINLARIKKLLNKELFTAGNPAPKQQTQHTPTGLPFSYEERFSCM